MSFLTCAKDTRPNSFKKFLRFGRAKSVLTGIFNEKSSISGTSPRRTTQRSARIAPALAPLTALTCVRSSRDMCPRYI